MSPEIVQPALKAARQLAALGHYEAATSTLDALGPDAQGVEALLLRAKMLAQQGQIDKALACWREVLAMEPSNQEAQHAVALASEVRGERTSRFYLRANLYYGLLLLVILSLSFALTFVAGRNAGRSAAAPTKALLDAQERQLQLSQQLIDAQRRSADNNDDRAIESIQGLEQRLRSLEALVDSAQRERKTTDEALRKVSAQHEESLSALSALVPEQNKGLERLLGQARVDITNLAQGNTKQFELLAGRLAALEKAVARGDGLEKLVGEVRQDMTNLAQGNSKQFELLAGRLAALEKVLSGNSIRIVLPWAIKPRSPDSQGERDAP